VKVKVARLIAVFALLPVMAVQNSFGWGADGHRIINRLAGTDLPDDVPGFLKTPSALDALSYYAPLPDHWRSPGEPALATATAPEHFIQLETIDKLGPLPRNRYDYVRWLAVEQAAHPDMVISAEKLGMQPYQTDEVWERLKVAMRDYRQLVAEKQDTKPVEQEIIFIAGWLGHYVGDGSQPLHTSNKPNGWIGPNPHGYSTDHHIHGQFESAFVGANVTIEDVARRVSPKPALIDDVFTQYVAYLRHTNTFVAQTYALYQVGAFTGAGTPAGKRFAGERLAAGATELRDLIYTAWVRSADPIPPKKS
jgi:S1/P1 Nuclease